jgi:hypothetical protein
MGSTDVQGVDTTAEDLVSSQVRDLVAEESRRMAQVELVVVPGVDAVCAADG